MKLRNKLQLFSLSILLVMAISLIAASSLVVEDLSHSLYEQTLKTELGRMRQSVSDTLKHRGVEAAIRVATAFEAELKQEPLRLKTAHAYIFEAPDRAIVHRDHKMGEQIVLARLFQQGEGTVEYDHNGSTHYAAYTTIHPVGWIMFLSVELDEIQAKGAEYLRGVTLIAIIIVGITTMVVGLFVRRFVGRLQASIDCIKRVESGDLSVCPVPEAIDDEVGHLQHGVNAMSASIQARTKEQQHADQALRESESKFSQIFETSNEGIWLLGENSITTLVNDQMAEMLGYTSEEMQGRPFVDFMFKEDEVDHWQKMEGRRKGLSEVYERRLRHREGVTIWALVSDTPILDDEGRFRGSIAMLSDVSDRRKKEDRLAASEQLFRAMIENSPDLIGRYDRELRRIYVNPALEKLFGVPMKQVLGKSPLETSPLTDPERYAEDIRQTIKMKKESTDELSYLGPDGEIIWVNMRFVPEFDADGKVASVLTISRDVTKSKQAEEQMQLAASVFANSQGGILITDANNHIIDVNPSFTRLTGYSKDEVLGRNPRFLSAGQQGQEFYDKMWRSITTRGEWQGELWNRRKSGVVYAELLSIVAVNDEDGVLQHYVGSFTDITEFKQHEADLDRIAHYDALTLVPNRRLLTDRMEQAVAYCKRHGKNLAVCYLDLDGFKPINDEFGHEAGDYVLVEIASRLKSMSRAGDTVARLGGDEFVLLWNDVGPEANCINALKRVMSKISEPILVQEVEVSVCASIGVTLYPDDDVDPDDLLRHADRAMYSAKQLGKDRYQMFDQRIERQMVARVDFLNKVGRALEGGELELYYQPKVDCVDCVVEGVEALVRWNDPIIGLVGAKEFLPLIENDILAFRVNNWVVEQALQNAKSWDDMGIKLPVSINIFPRYLKHRTFMDDLRKAIQSHWPQLPKNRLQIEIVESSSLEDLELIEEVILECKEMGIGFSLDDFGTGYSSLVYLRRLSVDELKIDQSFVHNILEDSSDQAIVVSVIALGQAFGLRVVAEGVETAQHAKHLMDHGCRVVQGFAIGQPMPPDAFEVWYADFMAKGVKMCK